MGTEDKIFNVFSGWFNSDLVTIENPQEVQEAASSCAVDLVRNIPDIGATVGMLSDMLDAWTPAIIGKFMNAGLIDWLYDRPTEQILKHVIELIIAELRYYKGHPEAFQQGAKTS